MCAARLRTLRRVGLDLDRAGDRVGAGRLQRALPLDLDHADPADAGDAQVGVVAQRRDADARAAWPPRGWSCPAGTLSLVPSMSTVTGPPMHRRRVAGRDVLALLAARAPGTCSRLLMASSLIGLRQAGERGRPRISSWKCSTMDRKALGLDWPSPHLEASCMVSPSASSSCRYAVGALAPLEHLDALEQLHVADPARRALAAGLLDEELQEVLGHVEHVAVRAEDDDRAAGGDVLEGDARGRTPRPGTHVPGRAADLHRLGVRRRRPPRAARPTVMPSGNS